METPNLLCGGRFQLTRQLGEGGMAMVHQAYDHRLQVWRAVKTLLPAYAKRKKLRQRFLGEAQAMARLEHKNIVRVYDVGEDGPTVYIVMELVDGGALEDWLETNGQMPPRLAVRCLLDVCAGIQAAHDVGIIHRDIKPHNVLVDRNGVCKVTDFGIAQVKDTSGQMTRTGTVMGTLGFMAPEQRTDSKHIDERADVYSLGASLFTMVTSRTSMDLFASEQDDSILADVGAELKAVISKATRYHPKDRYENVEEFATALRGLLPKLPPDPASTAPLVRPRGELPPAPELPETVDTTTFSTELGEDQPTALHTPAMGAPRAYAGGPQAATAVEPSVTAASRIRSGFEEEMPTGPGVGTLPSREEMIDSPPEESLAKRIKKHVQRIVAEVLQYAIGEGFLFRFLLPAAVIVIGLAVWINLGAENVNLAAAEFRTAERDFVEYVYADAASLNDEMLQAGVKAGVVASHRDAMARADGFLHQKEAAERYVAAAESALVGIHTIDPRDRAKVKKAQAHADIMRDKWKKADQALREWFDSTEGSAASTAIQLGLADAPPTGPLD